MRLRRPLEGPPAAAVWCNQLGQAIADLDARYGNIGDASIAVRDEGLD